MASVDLELAPSEITPPGDTLYEIVDGKLVEKSMGVYEVHAANLIDFFLGRFVFDHKLGFVEAEMLFNFGVVGQNQRRPDIAFISYDRWPKGRKFTSENALRVVPDLVVDVVSPSNFAHEVDEKIVEYLKAGVRHVWAVYPITGRLYIHDGSSKVGVSTKGDEIDGGEVLPGFRLALTDVFEDEVENA